MTELQRELEAAIRRLYRGGNTGERLTRKVRDTVRAIVRMYGSAADLQNAKGQAKDLLRQLDAESWQEFKSRSENSDGTRDAAAGLLLGTAQRLDRNDRKAVREIQNAILQSRKDGKSWRETAQAAMIKAGVAQQHALTEIETTLAAIDTSNTVNQAIEAGYDKFRYDGPTSTRRPFCMAHVGQSYTLAEIRSMTNGQGLPVLYYRGGYNCRHRWVPVEKIDNRDNKTKAWFNDKCEVHLPGQGLEMFGHLSNEEIKKRVIRIAGAPDGSQIYVDEYRDYDPYTGRDNILILKMEVINNNYFIVPSQRKLQYNDYTDEWYMYNEILKIKESVRGTGIGARILARQVKYLREYTYTERIHTYAAGSDNDPSWNGYYTWARVGYDAPLMNWEIGILPPELSNCQTLNDLMETEGGAEWWRHNGSGRPMDFYLDDDSQQMRIHRNYLDEKGIRI